MSLSEIPKEKLPEEWQMESRLDVMYAPYRRKNLNERDWDSKCKFWSQTIYEYCKYHKNYVCVLDVLTRAFEHNGRRPSCLMMVMQDMYDRQELVTVHEFKQKLKPSTTWAGWTADLLMRKPMAWGFNMMKQYMIRISVIDEGVFVHTRAVEHNARLLLQRIPPELKFKLVEFKDLTVFKGHNEENALLLLHYLECIGEASCKEIEQKGGPSLHLVKFGNIKHTGGISDSDIDVFMLGKTEKILLDMVEKLEKEIAYLVGEVKTHMMNGHKQRAKMYLRRKHDMDKRIESRTNALYNVQTLMSRVEDASHDARVLDTYHFALESLRKNFNNNKLNEDNVTKTMIEIGDILDIHNDIQTSMAAPLQDSDGDIEAELEQLLAEGIDEKDKPKPKSDSFSSIEFISEEMCKLDLPDVPSDEPEEGDNSFSDRPVFDKAKDTLFDKASEGANKYPSAFNEAPKDINDGI